MTAFQQTCSLKLVSSNNALFEDPQEYDDAEESKAVSSCLTRTNGDLEPSDGPDEG